MAAPTGASRDDIIKSLGLDPSRPGSTDAAKDARIDKALRAAQRLDYFFQTAREVKPDTLPSWTRNDDQGLSLEHRFTSSSVAERNSLYSSDQTRNYFLQLRQMLGTIGKISDETPGARLMMIQDEAGTSGFCLHVLQIRAVRDFSLPTSGEGAASAHPLLVVAYDFNLASNVTAASPAYRWNQRVTGRGIGPVLAIPASVDEQYLLYRLLSANAALLPADFKPATWSEESDFKISFILPCFPLNSPALAKLQFPHYCGNGCEKEASLLCSACSLVYYCSKDCQVDHWHLQHKDACKKSRAEPHYTMKVVHLTHPNDNGGTILRTNYLDSPVDMFHKRSFQPSVGHQALIPDLYGEKLIQVKMQITVLGFGVDLPPQGISLTNPEKTIDCKFLAPQVGYDHLFSTIRQRGREGIRLYMYAQRVDASTIKLFYENLPRQDTRW